MLCGYEMKVLAEITESRGHCMYDAIEPFLVGVGLDDIALPKEHEVFGGGGEWRILLVILGK